MMLRRKSQVSKMQNGYEVLLFLPNSAICEVSKKGVAVLNSTIPDHEDFFIKFTSKHKSTYVKAERLNDTSISFNTPENFPPGDSTVSIHHGVGQSTLCSYSRPFTFKPRVEQLAELLSTVTEPLSLIASAYKLNENDIVAIDFKMSSIFQMNCPKDFHLLKENSMDPSCRIAGEISTLSNPTLLHFAARFNLVNLSAALLQCPGSSLALNSLNNQAETPVQLAEKNGNEELAQLMIDARNNNFNTEGEDPPEDIYEEMTSIEFKKNSEEEGGEIYEEMENAPYDYTYSSRRLSNLSKDRQSVYSSDSGISTGSSDSRGSSSSGAITASSPPPVPPADYTKPKGRPPAPNPLIVELRKKTEKKRNPNEPTSPETPSPSRPLLPKPPVARRTKPINSYEDVECRNPSNFQITPETDPDEIYDTPKRTEEIYDTPPQNVPVPGFDQVSPDQYEQEIYDSPSPCAKPFASFNEEVYDSPTNSPVLRSIVQRNRQKSLDRVPVNDEVYDIPPRSDSFTEETYDIPPSNILSKEETYDVPSPGTYATDETYDVPPTSVLSPNETYDVPPTNFEEETYDVPAVRATYPRPLPACRVRKMSYGRSTESLNQNNEARDTVSPLSPSNNPLPPESVRTRKRYSAPTLNVSNLEQQRLISMNSTSRPPPLPPPVLPPRNAANSMQPLQTPTRAKSPLPPPPARPTRRGMAQ